MLARKLRESQQSRQKTIADSGDIAMQTEREFPMLNQNLRLSTGKIVAPTEVDPSAVPANHTDTTENPRVEVHITMMTFGSNDAIDPGLPGEASVPG